MDKNRYPHVLSSNKRSFTFNVTFLEIPTDKNILIKQTVFLKKKKVNEHSGNILTVSRDPGTSLLAKSITKRILYFPTNMKCRLQQCCFSIYMPVCLNLKRKVKMKRREEEHSS